MHSQSIRAACFAPLLLLSTAALAQDFQTNIHPPPKSQSPAITEADAALAAGDYPKALKLLTPLAAADPHNAQLAYDLGASEDALNQTSAAEQSYRAAIADAPTLPEPRVALGLLLARSGKLADARTELSAAVALPEHADDKALRARALRALARIDAKSRPADARDELLEALKLTPETPEDTLLSAELAQSATNGAPAAEAAYRRVLAQDPGNPEATSSLAHLLIAQKHDDEAKALLQAALKQHPNDPTLTIQLAALLGDEEQSAQALPLVRSLHQSAPENFDIARALSRLYLSTGDSKDAEPLLARLSAQRPRDTSLIDDHARALIHLQRFAEAQKILTPAVAQASLFPSPEDLGEAATDLAYAASENNEPAAALQALKVRGTVLPPTAPVLFLAAISHDHLHQVVQARTAYRQFLEAAHGTLPDQELQAQQRLITLDRTH